MASNAKPYTSLLAQNGSFGDMFWPKEGTDRKGAQEASSMIANDGSERGESAARRNLDRKDEDVRREKDHK